LASEAWPEILKRRLSNPSVINLDLIGSGLTQYLRVYETFGVDLHPKLVIVGLFLANDLWDTLTFDQWLHSGDGDDFMAWRDSVSDHLSFDFRRPVNSMKSLLEHNRYCYKSASGSLQRLPLHYDLPLLRW
jgi:hypothetical protein